VAVINGIDYGDLDSVQAPAPGTFSSPMAAGAGTPVAAQGVVVSLWVLLGIEIFVLVALGRSLRRHNGG